MAGRQESADIPSIEAGRLMGDWRKNEISSDELVKQMSGGAGLDALEHELQRGTLPEESLA